jgi:hypothetical protein
MSIYLEQIHFPFRGPNWEKIGWITAAVIFGGVIVYHVFWKKPAIPELNLTPQLKLEEAALLATLKAAQKGTKSKK